MAEYIERKALREAFDNADADIFEEYEDGYCDYGFGRQNILEVINSVPAADVAPVRHGRWNRPHISWFLPMKIKNPHCFCTNCAYPMKHKKVTRYCPNCGSRMDLEEPNETKET